MKGDTPRAAVPLAKAQRERLRRAIKAANLPMDKVHRGARVSRAALFRALGGKPVLKRTRAKLVAWMTMLLARSTK